MSTESQIARVRAATRGAAVINPGGGAAGARASDRATRLAAAEATTAAAT
jgi:hypothetical protein